ncbi:hypothetical protein BGZ83_010021 [Gryganskiella cystojenkinii]|nr:hypothetical protein BGZ83_010021 [Gryganskiella cystojenkinii]
MTVDNPEQPQDHTSAQKGSEPNVKMVPHPLKGEGHMRPDRIDIGDGLIMRWSTRKDADNVAGLMAEAFRWIPMGVQIAEDEEPKPNEMVSAAVKRLLRGNSAVMTEYDYAVVENTLAPEGENPLVACICLQQSPGYYGKVALNYGKPEAVGSHPDYRNKGLIRRLFSEMIHPASDQRGDVIQIIPGIYHFYRQFGYEYAIGLRIPRKIDNLEESIPSLPEHETIEKGGLGEPFQLRVPTLDDIPYLVSMSTPEKMLNQAEVGILYDEAYWRYNIHDVIVTAESRWDHQREHRIIVDAKTGKDCGVVMTHGSMRLYMEIFVLEDGYSYRDALHPVIRQMVAIANTPSTWELKEQAEDTKEEEAAAQAEDKLKALNEVLETSKTIDEAVKEQEEKEEEKKDEKKDEKKQTPATAAPAKKNKSMGISVDSQHPVAKLLKPETTAMTFKHRLYTRIPSYAKFLLKVAPTLEDRLAKSCLAGITVTWEFDFYRKVLGSSGKALKVVFESGKLVSATDDWVPPSPYEMMIAAQERKRKAKEENRPDVKPLVYEAKFAPLTFTRLLVGDLTMDQMTDVYGECHIAGGGDDAQMMLDILFPKQTYHFDMFWW